jgi:hypothetical protein
VLAAFDPATGKPLWHSTGIGLQVYTSVLPVGDTVIAFGSGLEGASALAVRTGGTGDVTDARRAWRADRVKGAIGSGVVHEAGCSTSAATGWPSASTPRPAKSCGRSG